MWDPQRSLVWLQARRDISPGEEIQYEYSSDHPYSPTSSSPGFGLMHNCYDR